MSLKCVRWANDTYNDVDTRIHLVSVVPSASRPSTIDTGGVAVSYTRPMMSADIDGQLQSSVEDFIKNHYVEMIGPHAKHEVHVIGVEPHTSIAGAIVHKARQIGAVALVMGHQQKSVLDNLLFGDTAVAVLAEDEARDIPLVILH